MLPIVVVLLLAVAPRTALATHAPCGSTLTSDTTLDSDLSCTDTALVIGADGISVDLAGHTIAFSGVLPDFGPPNFEPHGVSDFGFDDVTIRGGTIVGFHGGVQATGADALLVEDLILIDNTFGIGLRDVHYSRIANNIVNNAMDSSTRFGIGLNQSSNNVISNNLVKNNGLFGITMRESSDNLLEGNRASGNANGFHLDGSSGNTLEGNTANDNENFGFTLSGGSSDNTLEGNTATGNLGEVAFNLIESSGNTLLGNTASNNVSHGFGVGDFSFGNTLKENNANANGGSGFIVGDVSSGNTLEGNKAEGNGNVSNQQKRDTLGAERSGAGWRSGELPEGPVVASSPFGGLSLHLLPAL